MALYRVTLPDGKFAAFRKLCANNNISMAEVVRGMIDQYINDHINDLYDSSTKQHLIFNDDGTLKDYILVK